jgi:glycosyltransferase involved in cell wall biosynthesis
MKVVMVTAFPEDASRIRGGVAAVSVNLCRALSRLPEVSLEIIAFGESGRAREADFESMGVHFVAQPSFLPGFAAVWHQPRTVRRLLAGLKFDLVHVQGMPNIAARMTCPSVLTIHGIRERDALFRGSRPVALLKSGVLGRIESRARRRASNVIAISPYVREVLGGELTGRVWDIENPVEDGFFNVRRDARRGRVLYCGLVRNLKNVTGLIKGIALAEKRCPDIHLRIAGEEKEPEYSKACRSLAAELGLVDRVQFLGGLSVDDLQEEMARASCQALCSFQENAPMVIAEAMAAGVPVVASRVGGVPHMVADGKTGRLVEPESPESIAAGLVDVLNSDHAENMSRECVAVAEKRFRAASVARQTVEVYRAILGCR